MRVLVVTNMWPGPAPHALRGIFVHEQVEALRRHTRTEVDVLHADIPRHGRAGYAALIPRLATRLSRGGYDVVHAHYGLTGVCTGAVPTRVPKVLTLHGSDVNIGWQRRLSRWAARRAQRRIYVASALRDRLGVDGEVLPCGVDTKHFRPLPRDVARERFGLATSAPVVLFAGARSNPIKGYERLEAALALLTESAPVVIELSGYDRDEVPWLMAAANVLALTSHHEGSPQVVKEAVACGLPVVSVPVGDVAERLAAIAGCSVVSVEPEAIASAIDDTLRRRHRLQVNPEQLDDFSNARVAARLVKIYEDVLATSA